ncbi:MAG TPA: DUF934 domain-containing protein [Stellaceae bacterium]|nr:DUF934 domain-containing protein [Stellaceae bacterium]
MPLIKGGRFVDDPWRVVGDDEPVPDANHLVVSHARWLKERDALAALPVELGLRLPNTVHPSTLGADLDRLALIALNFPRFTDGRAYSQARLLRGRFGFRGEIRAEGDVLRDQLLFMKRCGIDAFSVGERAIAEGWLRAFRDFDVFYQPAEDGAISVLQRRLVARTRAPADFTVT